MRKAARRAEGRGKGPGTTGAARLGNPLAFLHEDDSLKREVCDLLDRLAAAEAPQDDDLPFALGFLRFALPLHRADEEEGLFPLLKRRCLPEDEIDRAIDRLSEDHARSAEVTPGIVGILRRIELTGQAADAADREALAGYAAAIRRHLVLENAVILPLARSRLTPGDLVALRREMLARRGLDRVLEAQDAG